MAHHGFEASGNRANGFLAKWLWPRAERIATNGRTKSRCIKYGVPVKPAAATWVLRVGLADHRLDAGDPFLRHKTTRRAVHDGAFADAAASGLDEALFLNRRGEIAEATRNSVFIEIDGRLATPPLSSGVLPGVLRGHLLVTGEAVEQSLTLLDLHQATRAFLGNSLNGLREFVLA